MKTKVTEPLPKPTSAPRPPSRHGPHRFLRATRDSLLAANVVIGTIWLASKLLSHIHGEVVASAWAVAVALSAMTIAVVGAITHDLYYWRLPIRRARNVLAELSLGEAPLDELKTLRRGVRCLMPSIMDLAHRERSLRGQIARLEQEVQQRVVTRTESLERKLGVLQVQASRDVLTGLSNRRALDLDLPKIVTACRAARRDLQLLMIDVDHFKILNDTLGHPAGDELLRAIGQVMRSTMRDGDTAFRFGGDEFVILLPGGDNIAATALADRLRSLVDGLTKHLRELPRRPKLSIGISSLADLPTGVAAEKLLAAADRRLYAVKHARPKIEQRVA